MGFGDLERVPALRQVRMMLWPECNRAGSPASTIGTVDLSTIVSYRLGTQTELRRLRDRLAPCDRRKPSIDPGHIVTKHMRLTDLASHERLQVRRPEQLERGPIPNTIDLLLRPPASGRSSTSAEPTYAARALTRADHCAHAPSAMTSR